MSPKMTMKLLMGLAALFGLFSFSTGNRYERMKNDVISEIEQELKGLEKQLATYDDVPPVKPPAPLCGPMDRKIQQWITETDRVLGEKLRLESYANWNYLTNLTKENAQKLELVMEGLEDWMLDHTDKAKEYLKVTSEACNATTYRMLRLLTQYGPVPTPRNKDTRRRISHLSNEMAEIYATTTIKRYGRTYRLNPELADIMSKSRDYDELLWAWGAWHNTTGRKLKALYTEFVQLINEAATDNGFSDIGLFWQYADFDQGDVESQMDKLYEQLLPFFEQLHAYVRKRLAKHYTNIDKKGCIPAHLLGNMWAQDWSGINDILLPFPNASSNNDVTKAMVDQGYTPQRMFHLAEEFFVSIGLEPMTQDFWNRSVIVRPSQDTPMECHASAEEFFTQTDFRIKMCTEVTMDDLQVVHHEMGHIEYFMQYRHLPTLFRTGANAAFHEAVGDTIALSVMTDTHLTAIGLIPAKAATSVSVNDSFEQDINYLMSMALRKMAFIPFGYIVDKWRYKVFRGDVTPDEYTSSWWKMREHYQGISAPVGRLTEDFDAGAKYHVPANVPYSRYFFSFIGQFQFQSELCKLAGYIGPLYKCDIYRSKEAGDRLRSVLSLGASQPWTKAMKEFTGQREFQVDAILNFFKPLIDWLKNDNKDDPIGWGRESDGYSEGPKPKPANPKRGQKNENYLDDS